MTTLNSDYRKLCEVRLPFQNRQKYMYTFDLANPVMADGYDDYLEPVVALCRAAGATHGRGHMTVDEKIVQAGMSQRRPGPHVDGRVIDANWNADIHGRFHGGMHNNAGMPRSAIIVASSAQGCRAWRGKFHGEPRGDGDLSHIADQLGDGEVLPSNVGYLLSRDCVHESVVQDRATQRSFLRIALPVEFAY